MWNSTCMQKKNISAFTKNLKITLLPLSAAKWFNPKETRFPL